MKIFSLIVIGLLIGLGIGWAVHTPTQGLDLQKAIHSGGLTVDCPVPYSLEYCSTHPNQF